MIAAVLLAGLAGFTQRSSFVNGQGRQVTRLQQTFDGKRVWASEAIVHREADGAVRVLDRGLQQDVQPEGLPALTEEQATKIALRDLAARGQIQTKAELVVFPTRFTGGIATQLDPESGKLSIDLSRSVHTQRPAAPFVWAYEVKTLAFNELDGHREESFIVDARTGAILRKWSAIRGAGVGHSYFSGTVPLETTQAGDGTYALLAQGRGTVEQPYLTSFGIHQTGLATYTSYYDVTHGLAGFWPYSGHATDEWGNGVLAPLPWDFFAGLVKVDYNADKSLGWPKGALTPAGETVAVDTHYAVTAGWDFYKTIFNRDGVDGQGTSTMALVHPIQGNTPSRSSPYVDRLSWSPGLFGIIIGEGTYPALSYGWVSPATVDLIGHELAHGVAQASASLLDNGLAGALDEANSDIFGKMLQAWVEGGRGPTIPEFDPADPTRWQLGLGALPNGNLFRYMDRPLDDGLSGNEWYDGLEDLGSHRASGPVDRFFVLLAQGVSTDKTSRRYSAYLPGGMPGIGNDHAARIWYRALTEQLFAADGFDAARDATITAAQELYGKGSNEEQSVMKAWAAVNVGSAPGEGPRVRVTFPVTNDPDSFLGRNAYPAGILSRVQFFPTRAKVQIRCDIANTADKRFTLGLATPNEGYEAGRVNDDGTWSTPSFPFYGDLVTITATSAADPLQYAKGRALIVEMDTDTDGETDAIDLGAIAMNWGVLNPPQSAVSISGGYVVSDWDVTYFDQAFANAWSVK